jgi:Flp pilus assembly protein TadG
MRNFSDYAAARLLIGVSDRIAGLAKACDGATAVETAIVLPAFLLLLFSIVEGGLLFWTQSTLQFAVAAAARCAAVNGAAVATNNTPPPCANAGIPAYAASQTYGMTIPSSTFTYTQPSCGYQVSASYVFSFIVAEVYPAGTITLTATSCHP